MTERTTLTLKEEAFARKCVELGSKVDAYKASHDTENMKASTLKVAACQLSKKPRVASRIAELEEQAAAEAKLSRSFVLRGLMDEASSAREGSARVRALELLGKATDGGLFVDRSAVNEVARTDKELRAELREIEAARVAAASPEELERIKAEIAETARLVEARAAELSGNVVRLGRGAQ